MINELAQLAKALEKANVQTEKWYREYKPLPNISDKAPCVRILITDGKVERLETVSPENGRVLRKYGSNQGTYPAMNLAPLYRIVGDENQKILAKMLKDPEKYLDLVQIDTWMTETRKNWGTKFCQKYAISMKNTPVKLMDVLKDSNPDVGLLKKETDRFQDSSTLFEELRKAALEMLSRWESVKLALQILFYSGKKDSKVKAEDDYGSLSVIFDCKHLKNNTVDDGFTKALNSDLMASAEIIPAGEALDAFQHSYLPSDDPMPEIKLAAGFPVSLRTMNTGAIPSLTRYGAKSNDTYPLSIELRTQFASALTWMGESSEKEGVTWVRTGVKDEALFAYPSSIKKVEARFAGQFGRSRTQSQGKALFEMESELFFGYMMKWRQEDPDTYPKNIQIFILRKLNKGCSKTIYNRQTSPAELLKCGNEWKTAARNLPEFPFEVPDIPFPMEIAGILNCAWKQNGTLASDKFRPIKSYHGVELQLDRTDAAVTGDLHLLVRNSGNLAAFAGSLLHAATKWHSLPEKAFSGLQDALVLQGMLLYWLGIRKEDYMQSYAFLFGQLLQLTDNLHELYCVEVRKGQLPTQLVGSSLYSSAAELPLKTLSQLGQRINPYISWAKTHRDAQVHSKNSKPLGPKASSLIWRIGEISAQLNNVMTEQTRFNDKEKAELFLGYMAAFPKKEKTEENTDTSNEEDNNE